MRRQPRAARQAVTHPRVTSSPRRPRRRRRLFSRRPACPRPLLRDCGGVRPRPRGALDRHHPDGRRDGLLRLDQGADRLGVQPRLRPRPAARGAPRRALVAARSAGRRPVLVVGRAGGHPHRRRQLARRAALRAGGDGGGRGRRNPLHPEHRRQLCALALPLPVLGSAHRFVGLRHDQCVHPLATAHRPVWVAQPFLRVRRRWVCSKRGVAARGTIGAAVTGGVRPRGL
mmetsp:Transcript_13561/g.32396  ORF Transcript_13561/g.32396 Transcript_13561/m.32396 type:complete len:229 (-) Transcript_13561:730-1416(-)